jgi:hypothetical protein
LVQWLNEIEDAHRYVIYEADPKWTRWSQRCIEQSDHLISIGDARAAAAPGDTESHAAAAQKTRRARWSLVLLHEPQTVRPTGPDGPGARRGSVYHVRRDHPADLEARAHLAGRGWLVLGEGARLRAPACAPFNICPDRRRVIEHRRADGARLRLVSASQALDEAEQAFDPSSIMIPVACCFAADASRRRSSASRDRDIEDLVPYFAADEPHAGGNGPPAREPRAGCPTASRSRSPPVPTARSCWWTGRS